MKNKKKFKKDRLVEACNQWVKLNILLLLVTIFLRLYLFFKLFLSHNIDFSSILIVASGVFYDVLFVMTAITFLLIPFIIIHYFLSKIANVIYSILIGLYSIFGIVLVEYFYNMSVPLDHVFFTYPVNEIVTIVGASVQFDIIPFIYWFVALAGVVLLFVLCKKIKISVYVSFPIIVVGIIFSIFFSYKKIIKNEDFYKEINHYHLAVNQFSYTYFKFYDYYKRPDIKKNLLENNDEIAKATYLYRSLFPGFNYVEETDYPFLRLADDKDVLGDFFNKTDDGLPPNFVFFIIEGFGCNLTGVVDENAVSLTPFIDSLSDAGLHWTQCLTSTARTFGVLPTVFASVPFGYSGFANSYSTFPNHNSLLKEMNKNGYNISFYYGGAPSFDGQQKFLQNNKASYTSDYIINSFSEKDELSLRENNRWGLDDDETFYRARLRIDTIQQKRPSIDIFLTLSTHEPFVFKEVEKYKQKVLEICKTKGFSSKQEEKNIMNNLDACACFLYVDDCIRKMYEYYQSLPNFENTIFVITGDHRMLPMVYPNYKLRIVTVPLIIYSPLLHTHKKMKAMVAHTDITPSINSFLNHNYNYKIEEYCHWLGTSFDTSTNPTFTKKNAFMENNRDVEKFLINDICLYNNKLYEIKPNFKESQYSMPDYDEKLEFMQTHFDAFMKINVYSVLNNYIYPISNQTITICDIYYDFDNEKYKEFKNIVSDSLGNKYAVIDSTILYGTLTNYQILENNYSDMNVDITFYLQSLDTTRNIPSIVITIGENDDRYYYKALRLTDLQGISLNTGNKEKYQLRTTIPMEDFDSKNKPLKIYLFNSKKSTMIYNDIKIKIDATPKSL